MGSVSQPATWLAVLVYLGLYLHGVQSRSTVSVAQGLTAELPCVVDASMTNPTVVWLAPDDELLTLNGDRMTSDTRFSVLRPYEREFNLQITKVSIADAGEYKCKLDNDITNPVHLQVTQAPRINGSSGNLALRVGENISMWCEASGVPLPSISWHRYLPTGQLEDLGVSGREFHIIKGTQADAGTYKCIADNGTPPNAMATISLDALFGPGLSLPHSQISQQEGRDTLLECLITASPHDTMYWHKAGVRLEDSSKYKVDVWDISGYTKKLSVMVRELTGDDYGSYGCVAENDYGRAEDNMTLYEWYTGHVRMLHPPKDTVSLMGASSVQINCSVEGLTHRDTLTWWRYTTAEGFYKIYTSNPSARVPQNAQSRQIYDIIHLKTEKYEIQGHYNLLVKNVSEGDAGRYMCEVTGYRNFTADLTLLDKVNCQDNTNDTYLSEGNEASFSCSLDFVGPAATWEVTWQHNERQLSSVNYDADGLVERKMVFPVYARDSGIYTCHVNSILPQYNVGECQVNLNVIEVPESSPRPVCPDLPKMDMSTFAVAMAVTVGCLLVTFIAVLSGVVLHYKNQLNKCKNIAGDKHDFLGLYPSASLNSLQGATSLNNNSKGGASKAEVPERGRHRGEGGVDLDEEGGGRDGSVKDDDSLYISNVTCLV